MVSKHYDRKKKDREDKQSRRASSSSMSSALSMMMIASVVAPKRRSDEKADAGPSKCPKPNKDECSAADLSTSSLGGRPRKQARAGRFQSKSSQQSRSSSIDSTIRNASRSRSTSVASRNSTISLGLTSNAGSIDEEQRQQNEAIARMLNDAQFKVPEVPLRRSVRSTQGKTPDRFTENEGRIRDTGIKPVTATCRQYKHKGFGCASLEAEHYPEYYDSIKNTKRCPFCHAKCFAYEGTFQQCCAKGRVDLHDEVASFQREPIELQVLRDERHNEKNTKNFLENVYRYNCELAFGSLHLERETVYHGRQVAKVNGAIRYQLSDFFMPREHSGKPTNTKRQFGQCFTLTPDDAIAERIERLAEQKVLQPHIIADLHRMLARDHLLAQAYQHCSEKYKEIKRHCDANNIDMPNFRVTLLKKRRAVEEGIDTAGIHDHRLLLPTEGGTLHCATVHFGENLDKEPPSERGIHLYGRDGRIVDFGYYDPNIDSALFPLIYPYGQHTYRQGIPLKKNDQKEPEKNNSGKDQPSIEVPPMGEDEAGNSSDEDPDAIDGEPTNCGPKPFKMRTGPREFLSWRQYYRYIMQIRGETWTSAYHWLWWGLWLAQVYVLTCYNRIEANEAAAVKEAQKDLMSCLPAVLIKAIEHKIRFGNFGLGAATRLGKIFFAPATFRGSRRYYQKAYADAQALCRAFGNPHVFLTFTINSEAPEFTRLFKPGQHWADHPMIVARFFVDKQKELMKDIVERQILGPVAAWYSTVEHQKRGLPHLHLIITLRTEENNYFNEPNWNPMTLSPEEWCHQYICAEIPAATSNRKTGMKAQRQKDYRETVTKLLIHTCNESCVVDGQCSKRFPRPFSAIDYVSDETYPVYRRRPPAPNAEEKKRNPELYGETFTTKPYRGAAKVIDNRHVVPHNPFLVKKFKSHINIEWMQGDNTAQYVTKYITKGCDLAVVRVGTDSEGTATANYDEFEEIRLGVYRTSAEAALGIWGHKIFDKSHSVETLYIHEPGKIEVVYEDGEEEPTAERLQKQARQGKERTSRLTEYFKLNATDPRANEHTYATVCKDYWWNKNSKQWLRRERVYKKITRIGSAGPQNTELQAIRLLLLNIKGPTSFDDLLVDQNGTAHRKFEHAAKARGLLDDDSHWDQTIQAALDEKRVNSERIRWFALFIANVLPQKSDELFKKYFDKLTTWKGLSRAAKRQRLLTRIEYILRAHGIKTTDDKATACEIVGLPAPENFRMTVQDEIDCTYFQEEFLADKLNDDDEQEEAGTPRQPSSSHKDNYKLWHSQCTEKEQRPFVDKVMKAVRAKPTDKNTQRLFFLTGAGGTGKTFTYNTIIAGLKANRLKVLPCASTGIAAELLIEGQTVHRRFGVPIKIAHDTEPTIRLHSNYAAVLDAAQVIIIDEISMQDRYVLEYVNRLLKAISKNNSKLPFAGKVVIIGGDWKQLMPVIPRGSSEVQFARSVKSSRLFHHFHTQRLTINKRLDNERPRTKAFSRYNTKLANGVTTDDFERINLFPGLASFNADTVIDKVFPPAAMVNPIDFVDQIKGSALLCPTVAETLKYNKILLDKIKGQTTHIFRSNDSVIRDDPLACLSVNATDRCVENLNRQTPSGLPPHELHIKVGAIMMIIKNLSVADGQCNGTRVQITKIISNQLLECQHVNGARKGQVIQLYKCAFEHGAEQRVEGEAPFKWRRTQFPLRPGFVMTINKSQGQTLDRVGLLLKNSQCFSHGQLYVAVSRVRNPESLSVLVRPGANSVKNIVYQPVLDTDELKEAYTWAEEDKDNEQPPSSDPPAAQGQERPNSSMAQASTSAGIGEVSLKESTIEMYPVDECVVTNVRGDGNCFFRSIGVGLGANDPGHEQLRRLTAQRLEQLDTEDNREWLQQAAVGIFDDPEEFGRRFGGSITRYAREYTATPREYAGSLEAMALANHLQRTIIIIRPRDQDQWEQATVYRPDHSTGEHEMVDKQYVPLWSWEETPLVVQYDGVNHYMAVTIPGYNEEVFD